MPPKARTSNQSAPCAPGQYPILSRPSSSDTLIAQSPPELSEVKVSRNAPTMVPSVLSPRAIPITPPRPRSMQSLPSHPPHQGSSPFFENKLRGSVIKSYGHTKTTSSPPIPRNSSDTPVRRPKSQTPSRSSTTTSQAYAGPLFHASPAASALPIPKWFSKMNNERKEPLEEIVLETATNKPTPDQIDESPTLRKSRTDVKQLPDEHPPIFHMPADRVEKDKGREGNAIPASVDEDSIISPSLSASTLVDSSTSPDIDRPHHPRHWTSRSSNELFPSETEDSSDSSVPKQGARPSTAPSDISAQIVDDKEQLKARSLALKKLLQTPVPQRLVSASSHLPTVASDNERQPFPPARISSGPSTSMASPAVKLSHIPCHSYLPSSCPHDNTQELLEATKKSHDAAQHLAPYCAPDTFARRKNYHDSDEYGMVFPRVEKQPLSNGQRAILIEDYLSRGTSGGNTCSCKSSTSPQQSSSSVESMSLKDGNRSKQIKDSRRSESSSKFRPTISSPQSFPGADSTPFVHYDPKKWLDNHLRHDILKISTLDTDSATRVAI
ncbi:hypothetical protein MMC22_006428 [Lobaria immixta]|nr:hypothetical protein [Lobaria immixta]